CCRLVWKQPQQSGRHLLLRAGKLTMLRSLSPSVLPAGLSSLSSLSSLSALLSALSPLSPLSPPLPPSLFLFLPSPLLWGYRPTHQHPAPHFSTPLCGCLCGCVCVCVWVGVVFLCCCVCVCVWS